MKTHKELLTELIEAVYALHISPTIKEVHDMQMKAAEIRGQMMATKPLQNETPSTQLDADGWVENTGVDPECMVALWKTRDGYKSSGKASESKFLNWGECKGNTITHYKPA